MEQGRRLSGRSPGQPVGPGPGAFVLGHAHQVQARVVGRVKGGKVGQDGPGKIGGVGGVLAKDTNSVSARNVLGFSRRAFTFAHRRIAAFFGKGAKRDSDSRIGNHFFMSQTQIKFYDISIF